MHIYSNCRQTQKNQNKGLGDYKTWKKNKKWKTNEQNTKNMETNKKNDLEKKTLEQPKNIGKKNEPF